MLSSQTSLIKRNSAWRSAVFVGFRGVERDWTGVKRYYFDISYEQFTCVFSLPAAVYFQNTAMIPYFWCFDTNNDNLNRGKPILSYLVSGSY